MDTTAPAPAPAGADPQRLERHVRALEGERHPETSPEALEGAVDYIIDSMTASGLAAERRPFEFNGREYVNVVAAHEGSDPGRPRVAVGAHFDTVVGSPGADDNASGVAVLLEVARLLAGRRLAATVELFGFNLEEPQGITFRVGSRALARAARREGVRYAGVLVLEMVGYVDRRPGSQHRPRLLFWKRIPSAGTFLAAVGDGQSRRLLKSFARAARAGVPELEVLTFRSPFRGRLVAATRLSDNASYWDAGYPSLMLTDTAFLRNPNYHRASDRVATLDFEFMTRIADATVAAVGAMAS